MGYNADSIYSIGDKADVGELSDSPARVRPLSSLGFSRERAGDIEGGVGQNGRRPGALERQE